MATDITTIFGTDITVSVPKLITERSFTGFVGANGVTSMHLGNRGMLLVIRGTLYAQNYGSYQLNRIALQNVIAAIEALADDAEIDLSYKGWTYYNCVMLPLPQGFRVIPGGDGREMRVVNGGAKLICAFESIWRIL